MVTKLLTFGLFFVVETKLANNVLDFKLIKGLIC